MIFRFMRQVKFGLQFAPAIIKGEKRQTVRRSAPAVGEAVELVDADSNQLKVVTVADTKDILIFQDLIIFDNDSQYTTTLPKHKVLTPLEAEVFAQADGFGSFAEFAHWIDQWAGLPFHGQVFYW